MTRAEMKKIAKEQIKGNFGKVFVMALIVFGISIVCSFIPVIGSLGYTMIITPVVMLSYCMIYLKMTRKEQVEIGNLIDGFKYTGKAVLLYILTSIYTFLWSLLFIIPGIIKAFAYSQAYYILAENPELTASEALKKSEEIMKGHKMEYFVLNLSFIGWFILTSFTFGILAIYVVPYMSAAQANFYNSIKQAE